MKYCKECGSHLKDEAIYCYVCGARYDETAPEVDYEAVRDVYKRKVRAEEKRIRAGKRNRLLVCLIVAAGLAVLIPQMGPLPKISLPSGIEFLNSREQREKAEKEASESRASQTREELQNTVAAMRGQTVAKAEEYIANGYYQQAIELLSLVKTYNQSDLEVQTLLTTATTDYENFVKEQVQIYLGNRDWDGAMALLTRAREDLPDNAVIDQLYTTTEASASLYQ